MGTGVCFMLGSGPVSLALEDKKGRGEPGDRGF